MLLLWDIRKCRKCSTVYTIVGVPTALLTFKVGQMSTMLFIYTFTDYVMKMVIF